MENKKTRAKTSTKKWQEPLFNLFSTRVDKKIHTGKEWDSIGKTLNDTGILVLDAHLNPLDTVATLVSLKRTFGFNKTVLPAAMYLTQVPILRNFFNEISRRNVEVFPVYRKEEKDMDLWHVNLLKKTVSLNYSTEQKKHFNKAYLDSAERALETSHSSVLTVPYGGPVWHGQKIKYGVVRLVRSGAPTIFSYSGIDYKRLKYISYFSNPIIFDTNESIEKIETIAAREYKNLRKKHSK